MVLFVNYLVTVIFSGQVILIYWFLVWCLVCELKAKVKMPFLLYKDT